MAYYKCLEERFDRLIAQGREVVIVGDLNIVRAEIDHPDPAKSLREYAQALAKKAEAAAAANAAAAHEPGSDDDAEDADADADRSRAAAQAAAPPAAAPTFGSHPARAWLNSILLPAPGGRFVDVGRALHPTRPKMYTCWNTVIDARPVNYGARLDYTLCTPGLSRWIKSADIQPHVYGSDHCPVFLELHDEIVEEDGRVTHISELLNGAASPAALASAAADSAATGAAAAAAAAAAAGAGAGAEGGAPQTKWKAPPIACANWPEFNGKQRKIASFFTSSSTSSSSAAKNLDNSSGSGSGSAIPVPSPAPGAAFAAASAADATGPSAAASTGTGTGTGSTLADALFEMAAAQDDDEALAHTQAQASKLDQSAAKRAAAAGSPSSSAPPATSAAAARPLAARQGSNTSTTAAAAAASTSAAGAKASGKSAPAAAAKKGASSASASGKKALPGQLKMTSFFAAPKKPASTQTAKKKEKKKEKQPEQQGHVKGGSSGAAAAGSASDAPIAIADSDEDVRASPQKAGPTADDDLEAALALEAELRAEAEGGVTSAASTSASGDGLAKLSAAVAWGQIFTPPAAPLCSLHQEPATSWTVNKSGPNHGRKFWLCSRKIGPGHEGSGVPRDQVNPEYRCDFFLWESDRQKRAKTASRFAAANASPDGKGKSMTPSPSKSKTFGEVGRSKRQQEEERAKNKAPEPHKRVKK